MFVISFRKPLNTTSYGMKEGIQPQKQKHFQNDARKKMFELNL